MSFFEGLGKKIAQSGQEAAQKAKNTAEIIKLNGMISEEEKRINNLHIQIGKLYYEVYGENPEEQFAQFITDINDAKVKIAAHTEQISIIKGIAKCTSCGGQVPAGAPFCSSCGSPISSASSASDDANNCANCGTALGPDVAFCAGCGSKVEQASQESAEDAPAAQSSCQSCGQELAGDVAFCLNCGTKVNG